MSASFFRTILGFCNRVCCRPLPQIDADLKGPNIIIANVFSRRTEGEFRYGMQRKQEEEEVHF